MPPSNKTLAGETANISRVDERSNGLPEVCFVLGTPICRFCVRQYPVEQGRPTKKLPEMIEITLVYSLLRLQY